MGTVALRLFRAFRPRRAAALAVVGAAALLGAALPAGAQTVTRGPYLQQGGPDRVTVRWRTDTAASSRVRYGTTLTNPLPSIVDVTGTRTEHEVRLTGLAANTKYYYSIGTTTVTLKGPDSAHFFVTSPAAGAAKPTRVWVLGDSGTADSNARAVRDAYTAFAGTRHTDLWLMLGDNAYPDGTDTQFQSAVFAMYPDMLRKSVLWPTLGNHDGHSADSATQSGPYYSIFSLPRNAECGGTASGTEAYYSFDYGNIHFLCLDSYETSRAVGGTMYTWAKNDAETSPRDWLIAFWHHPPYSKGSHNSDSEGALREMRANFLPMLEAAGVDLVLSGHSHSYERSFLLDGHYGDSTTFSSSHKVDGGSGRDPSPYTKPPGTPSHEGAVYVVAGSSGKTSGGLLNHPAMYISLNQLGSLVLDIDGSRLDARFLRSDGTVGDSFTILKSGTTNTPPSVSITSPAGGATYTAPATVTINASASDPDGTVAKVEFFQGTTKLGEDATSPYSFTWSGVPAGSYSLTARATDNGGASRTSSAVSITVNGSGAVTKSFQDGVAPTSSYAGTRDTKIRSGSPTTNYGSSTVLEADGSPDDGVLIKWDLSAIPAGSVVSSASITLTVTNATSHTYEIYSLKRNWVESQATWRSYASGLAWQVAGAQGSNDRGTTVLGSVTASATGAKTVSLNASGVAAVQSWVNTPSSNYGIVIQDYAGASDGVDFYSSEDGTAARRPRLTVTYTPPSTVAGFVEYASADVTVEGKGSYGTVREALDAAAAGDTVVLGPYAFFVPEGVTIKPGVTLRGAAPHLTILDGQGAAAVVRFGGTALEGRSGLANLTVTGGGVGIDTGQADVLLRNLQVVRNSGAGLRTGQQGRAEAVSLTVAHNGAEGIVASNAATLLRGLVVSSNAGTGIVGTSGTSLAYSTVAGNGPGETSGNLSLGEGLDFASAVAFEDPAAFDYREHPGAPSIDAGDPADDYRAEPDPNGGRINQGAFGNTPYAVGSAAAAAAAAAPGGPEPESDGASGGACGALGLEFLLLALLGRRRP
jgi:hypothetical protein